MDIVEVDEIGQSLTLYAYILQEWPDYSYDIIGKDAYYFVEVPIDAYNEGKTIF